MTAQIVPLFPSTMAAHPPVRRHVDIVRERLMSGRFTPQRAFIELTCGGGKSRAEAAEIIERVLPEMCLS